MKVILKYDQGVREEEKITLDIPEKELEKMVELDYQRRLLVATDDEIVTRRTPGDILLEWNRLEYNAWRRYYRHIATPVRFGKEEPTQVNADMIDGVVDDSQIEAHKKKMDYEVICQLIHETLKPAQAEMMIAICLDGLSVGDYAREIGDNTKNVSKRFNRVKKILKEQLLKKEI